MSIFIAPDAEGTLTVWADVPGKDPVALISAVDLTRAGVPVSHGSDTARAAAYDGVAELWQVILNNVPQYGREVLIHDDDLTDLINSKDQGWSITGSGPQGWYVVSGLDPADFTLIPQEHEVVDLVAALRASFDAATARRKAIASGDFQ